MSPNNFRIHFVSCEHEAFTESDFNLGYKARLAIFQKLKITSTIFYEHRELSSQRFFKNYKIRKHRY